MEASGGTAAAARADITDQQAAADAINALATRLGPADLLVNNAGVGGPVGDAWQVDPGEWWRAVEINLRGVYLCSRAVLPAMTARGTGRIVNITSHAGVYRWPQVSAYSVSKAAVIKFTENLAAEASHSGISAFSVHPGLTPIGLSERALASAAPPGSAEARINSWVQQELQAGRGAEPTLVARLVTRLAAGDADRLSGCHLSVHDDLDAILACGEGVRDRYQLRRAGMPKRRADPHVIVMPRLLLVGRGLGLIGPGWAFDPLMRQARKHGQDADGDGRAQPAGRAGIGDRGPARGLSRLPGQDGGRCPRRGRSRRHYARRQGS